MMAFLGGRRTFNLMLMFELIAWAVLPFAQVWFGFWGLVVLVLFCRFCLRYMVFVGFWGSWRFGEF